MIDTVLCSVCAKNKPARVCVAGRCSSCRRGHRGLPPVRARDKQRTRWRSRGIDLSDGIPPKDTCVCGEPATHLDHDHATGKIRGWLCAPCNRALGHVKDNPLTLRRLADYLER